MIQVALAGQTYPGFFEILDNINHFPNAPNVSACTQNSSWAPYYCPASEQSLPITLSDTVDANTIASVLEVGNGYTESNSGSGHIVWDDVGDVDPTYVVFGVDFFFGKTIYIGIVGLQSPLGIGPTFGF